MKVDSTTSLIKQMIEFEAQIKRSTGMDLQTLQRFINTQKEIEAAVAAEKMLPWNVLGISRETFAAFQEIIEDEAVMALMKLDQGNDSDALREHLENNPVSPECVIKLVRLAKSVAEKYTKGLSDEGRYKGGNATAKKAVDRIETLRKPVCDLFENTVTFDMKDGAIADFLMDRGLHKYKESNKEKSLGKRTMMNYVKQIREDYKASQPFPSKK